MIGQTIFHYKIIEKLGEGGMGTVYRARDTKLDRDVALKVLASDCAQDVERRQRFEREAKAAAALKHPNIVTIYSVEEIGDIRFIAMELVEGETLSRLIPEGGFEVARFLEIAIPIADAVSCAHAEGIVHRDLKPDNIMVIGERQIKVLDFGLAKHCTLHASNIEETVATQYPLTQAGLILGTIAYMSPEQIRSGSIDARSDIFSLGILFHELLSGSRPFRGENLAAIVYNIVNDKAPRLSSVPNTVADLVDRCLEKDPGNRYADALELRSALEDVVGASGTILMTQPSILSPEAKTAFDQGNWESARRELLEIREQRELLPEELEMLGTCEGVLGEFDDSLHTSEQAYAGYAKSGDNAAAARIALGLARCYIVKNADAVARGWQKRAERLLRDEPDCIEHGHLLRRQTVTALEKCDFAGALKLNERCAEVADRFNDRSLQVEALHDRGQILIARGDVEEGTELVDEAMASAVSGEVSPETVGNLYCRTMVVCRTLADFNRAREWSDAAARWCEPYPGSGFLGVCRIHSAETMRHQGRWGEAEQAIHSACDFFEKSGFNGHAGEAFNEFGLLALCRGEYDEAEKAFRRAHEFGHDPVPGLPLLRLAQGKGDAAQQIIERALNEDPENRLRRAGLLAAIITIALANGKTAMAEVAVEELTHISEDFDCPVFRAHAVMGRGALELERGNETAATPTLRKAWSMFNEMGLPYDAARARFLMATAYLNTGNTEDARLQLDAACKTFTELGAKLDLETASELTKRLE
ncbi:protein kinase [Candidatus Eisenbacteria bacterium]|uniref:Protein kinase n=1 Tax=Eiseniibacteriota bacterium TaxID=2212470 RepID=A0ABV6YLL2_UNCEI